MAGIVNKVNSKQVQVKESKVSLHFQFASGYLLLPMIIDFITVMWLYAQWRPH